MRFLTMKHFCCPKKNTCLPQIFKKVQILRQILILQQNSVFKGLKFSAESKLFSESPSCLCATSATLIWTKSKIKHFFSGERP